MEQYVYELNKKGTQGTIKNQKEQEWTIKNNNINKQTKSFTRSNKKEQNWNISLRKKEQKRNNKKQ